MLPAVAVADLTLTPDQLVRRAEPAAVEPVRIPEPRLQALPTLDQAAAAVNLHLLRADQADLVL